MSDYRRVSIELTNQQPPPVIHGGSPIESHGFSYSVTYFFPMVSLEGGMLGFWVNPDEDAVNATGLQPTEDGRSIYLP